MSDCQPSTKPSPFAWWRQRYCFSRGRHPGDGNNAAGGRHKWQRRILLVLAVVAIVVVVVMVGAVIGASTSSKSSDPVESNMLGDAKEESEPATPVRTKRPTGRPTLRSVETKRRLSILWQQLGADLDGEDAFDYFGYSVALSSEGTIVAVGAFYNDGNGRRAGHVRVFQYSYANKQWSQLGSDLDGEAAIDHFGHSVALSADGSIVAVGAIRNDGNGNNAGHVRVFQYNQTNTQWNQLGSDLDGEAAGDQFGFSVDLSADGSILAIGANGNGSAAGHVRIFQYNRANTQWNQLGSDLDGGAADDYFGWSVALSADGSIVAAGAPRVNGANGQDSGYVRVFQYSQTDTEWNQLGSDLDGEAAGNLFGLSVALSADGSIVAVGGTRNEGKNGEYSGHVRVFQYNQTDTEWNQLGSDLDGEAAGDGSGWSVALSADGSIVAIGAYFNDGTGDAAGHVRLYKYSSRDIQWNQRGPDLDGEAAGDRLGWSVALSADGSVVAVGAIYNDGTNGVRSGHVRVFESAL